MIGLAPEKFRIRSIDVGGAFGVRNEVYPEFLAVMLAAKRTGRPVKWHGTRSETMSGDHHARAADLTGELALDRRGKFLALRVQWLVNLGAFASNAGPLINTVAAPTSSAMSLYNVGAIHGRHRLVFTNTTPTTAYRGAGRPNVAYLWERLVEEAAVATGIDPVEIRRRNVLRKDVFPLKTLTGSSYDSADPARLLDTALQAADWAGFKERRRAAKKNGKLRGIGLALFLEPSGGMGKEQVEIRVGSDGKLAMYSNAGPSGQGHETVFPALVADILGFPEDRIELRYNDVAQPKLLGTGSFGSRSLICHGAALTTAAKEIVEKGSKLAAARTRGRAGRRHLRQGAIPRRRHRPVDQHQDADREEMGRAPPIRSTPTPPSIWRSPIRAARISPRSRSIRRPEPPASSTTSRPTTAATSSITSWSRASCTAA